jgi:hypothetical protein
MHFFLKNIFFLEKIKFKHLNSYPTIAYEKLFYIFSLDSEIVSQHPKAVFEFFFKITEICFIQFGVLNQVLQKK